MESANQDIAGLRKEYSKKSLDVNHVKEDPFEQFREWFDEALKSEVPEANAMTLSTTDEGGRPSGRIVLLKAVDEKGFVFYTNFQSRKGKELENNPYAAITFFWVELERQVRVRGAVEKVDGKTADEYFSSRPIGSKQGAWVSPQSQPIPGKETLLEKFREVQETYPGEDIPRPPYWGGFRVIPDEIEFWQGRPNRLHDRIWYGLSEEQGWTLKRLAP